MAVVGPGANQQQEVAPEPLLQNASEFEYVTIFNPMEDDFQIMVAQEVPVNMPFSVRDKTSMIQSDRDVASQYGLNLKNPDHQGKKHIYNDTVIPSKGSMRFKGSDAKVIVKQLVDEIMQRNGKARLIADPTLRNEIESKIIQSRGSMEDILTQSLTTPSQQITEAINQANEVNNEQAFAGLSQPTDQKPGEGSADLGTESPSESKSPSSNRKKV